MTKYVNILNDDAFKVVIFTPGNEELLARMIEIVIPGMHIKQLVFQPTEQHGLAISDKISNFDAVCTSDSWNWGAWKCPSAGRSSAKRWRNSWPTP